MNKMFSVQVLACFLTLTAAAELSKIGDIIQVRDGVIEPAGAVASITNVAQVAAIGQAAISQAAILQSLHVMVTNKAAELEALINAREGVGYLRGGVESFEPAGVVHNTNIVASIVKFEHETTPTNVIASIYTYFSEDPGTFPYTRINTNLRETNSWVLAENEVVEEDQALVGDTLYDCYRSDVYLPLSYSNAAFRVFADVVGSGTNQTAFTIYGNLKVGEYEGVNVTIIDGTNTYQYTAGALTDD
ncbi:MAG: hypothetical protein PF904_10920 [Kiritimatiellae bacterium]|jgi:hypothetical protein|nr:hypothetical protein [Kiritimatiellia bacterium]